MRGHILQLTRGCAAGLMMAGWAALDAQEYEGRQLVEARLVAAQDAAVPGETLRAGLHLRMAEGWHTYWSYVGDSGLATSLDWELPEGVEVSDFQWPLPLKLIEPGDLQVYAYKDEVLLLFDVQVPADFDQAEVTLQGEAAWLVCEAICLPGEAWVELVLPVAESAEPAHEELFARFEAKLPVEYVEAEAPFQFDWSREDESLFLHLRNLPPDVEELEFFPLPTQGEIIGHPDVVEFDDGSATIGIPVISGGMEELAGVVALSLPTGAEGLARSGWQIGGELEAEDLAGPTEDPQITPVDEVEGPGADEAPIRSIWYFLVGAFIGGLILNVMPCVLPAISLKVFGFIRDAGEEPARVFKLGLAFSAGILAFFLVLAFFLLGLREAGQAVGWGIQFQNPYFLLTMCAILVVFALNLFGVFEITLSGQAQNQLTGLSQQAGYGGSFFHGVFATILATPCTAPFLGSALGFAFAQPGPVVVLVFATVALGMASPYLVLTARPAWMKFLPKPGQWMVKLKQFMGFLLLGTMLWLLWVLGRQKGVDGILWAGAFLLILGLSCWIKGAFTMFGAGWKRTASIWVTIAILVVGGYQVLIANYFARAEPPRLAAAIGGDYDVTASHADGIRWEPFSQARLAELREMGYPIFIDFTADWCINCKVNERRVLETAPIREALNQFGIVPMKADYTRQNPEITEMLEKFQHGGVPMYVVYPAHDGTPFLLPELLTHTIVLDAFRRATEDSLALDDGSRNVAAR